MCLILLAYDVHPACRLVVAANRDEYYGRPTAPADFWPDAPSVLAGRDLKEGGTWMGITRQGRFAALTNYRDPAANRPGARSRGLLVADYLRGQAAPSSYLAALSGEREAYNPFNLLAGDRQGLWYLSSRTGETRSLAPGIYGLSNHLLDSPWPKLTRGKSVLARLVEGSEEGLVEALLEMLSDRFVPEDADLPDTGIGIEWERLLGSAFIASPDYGTRSSSVLLERRDGSVVLVEREFRRGGEPGATVQHRLQLV